MENRYRQAILVLAIEKAVFMPSELSGICQQNASTKRC